MNHRHRPKIKPAIRRVEFLVGAAGFEPTLTESESGVLPLNYAPMCGLLYIVSGAFAIYFFYLPFVGGTRIICHESKGIWVRGRQKSRITVVRDVAYQNPHTIMLRRTCAFYCVIPRRMVGGPPVIKQGLARKLAGSYCYVIF